MRPVPNKLLLWIAFFFVIPACTVLVYDTGAARLIAIAALGGLVLVCLADYLLSQRLLQAVDLSVPELIRGTKGRKTELPLEFSLNGQELKWIRYGLNASPFFRFEKESTGRISPLKAGRKTRVAVEIIPLQRGKFFFESIHIETRSLMGLWLTRRKFDPVCELRVYPDLATERKRLASLFLMRGQDGSHIVRQVGKGRDFEQLREYQPGDDYVDIDWKATARRGIPVTRTYQIEKTQEVYVVVDHSRLSGREIRVPVEETQGGDWLYAEESSGGDYLVTTQLEKFLHCSLILASVAERQGDLFGFVSFADNVTRFIRGRNGKEHYNLVRDALYTLEPEQVAPDFEQLMISLRQRLTRRALIVMLVDLSDPLTAEHFFEALPLINRQHLVLVNMVKPEHAHPVFSGRVDPETVSEIYEELGGHFQWQEIRETRKRLHHLGVELGTPEHAELCTETVTQYLNIKNRQLI
ncbi:MAG: DUF58 domain-containing protein [Verrucomicrobiales bacterium]|nr:DUF58 domain-containing protein [Verrucomicrobiales bacterium]